MDFSPEFIEFATTALRNGLKYTIIVTVLGTLLALVTAFVMGIGRLSEHAVIRGTALVFIELFRGTSLVAQLFFFFFALPAFGVRLDPVLAGVLAIGLNEGAYAAEIVRGSIGGRAAGQNEACTALNMGKALRMRRVLIPQSIPSMLPSFGNVTIDLLKNSSLTSFVGVTELTFSSDFVVASFGNILEVYIVVLVIYFLLSQFIAFGSRWAERRFALDRESRSFTKSANRSTPVSHGGLDGGSDR